VLGEVERRNKGKPRVRKEDRIIKKEEEEEEDRAGAIQCRENPLKLKVLIPWWSSGQDSALSLSGPRFELRSFKLHRAAKKKKKRKESSSVYHLPFLLIP